MLKTPEGTGHRNSRLQAAKESVYNLNHGIVGGGEVLLTMLPADMCKFIDLALGSLLGEHPAHHYN